MAYSLLAMVLLTLQALSFVRAVPSATPTCTASCPVMDNGNNSPPTTLFTSVDSPPSDILCFYFDGSACLYNKSNGNFDGAPGSTDCPSTAPLTCTYSRRSNKNRRASLPISSRGEGQQRRQGPPSEFVRMARFQG